MTQIHSPSGYGWETYYETDCPVDNRGDPTPLSTHLGYEQRLLWSDYPSRGPCRTFMFGLVLPTKLAVHGSGCLESLKESIHPVT